MILFLKTLQERFFVIFLSEHRCKSGFDLAEDYTTEFVEKLKLHIVRKKDSPSCFLTI